jgi:hypothetical protein
VLLENHYRFLIDYTSVLKDVSDADDRQFSEYHQVANL